MVELAAGILPREYQTEEELTPGARLAFEAGRQMWPTPNVPNGGRSCAHVTDWRGATAYHNGKKVQVGLEYAVKQLATPTARDWRSGKASQETMDRNSRPLSEQIGGSLSPDWVELLLGWPLGWTSLEPLQDATMRGWGEGWEDGIPRVAQGVTARVDRLKAIGNGQVPQCAAEAWGILTP